MVDAGWYRDPIAADGTLRYWDGQAWTEHVHAPVVEQPVAPVVVEQPVIPRVAIVEESQPPERGRMKVGFFGARAAAEQALRNEEDLRAENMRLRFELDKLGGFELAELESMRDDLRADVAEIKKARDKNLKDAKAHLKDLNKLIVQTEDAVVLQEVGIYEFTHILEDSVAYKAEIAKLRDAIKTAAKKSGGAVTGAVNWQVNGSQREGAKMVNDFSKLMLRAYNAEADTIVASLKPYKLAAATDRLTKVANTIMKLGSTMSIQITPAYHRLRLKELQLVADYQERLAQEKERDREARERMREEAKLQAELEREKARLSKQEKLKVEALAKARASGDEVAIARLEAEVAEAGRALEELDHRATNLRLGHVYVISNVGSFGDGVVKIGMTRRMEPMDRVNELGDASVPFKFDVHAIIYSEDAVALESKLHDLFEDRRVNRVNRRREFFRATPEEVRAALIDLGETIIEYRDDAVAEEYRMSGRARAA